MGTLAHILEAEGLATVMLSQVRGHAEALHPPRALHVEFPLGRPLGRPNDPAFQRGVLDAAFALLERPTGPVLEVFPEEIEDEADQPLACALPPRHDPDEHPAVDEARALLPAWQRARTELGRTIVGRVLEPEQIPDAVAAFVRVVEGTPWKEAGIPGDPISTSQDIRAFYEEAAVALAEHIPAARAAETWFFHHTEAGKTIGRAQALMSQGDDAFGGAYYLRPGTQAPVKD